MDDTKAELNELFAAPNTSLERDVLGELQSLMRIHSLSPQELFFKWEAYSIKMGPENTRIDYKTARDFKKDLQDALERESRGKAHMQSAQKRNMTAAPRNAATGDVFGVLDSLVTGTPTHKSAAMKRRGNDIGTPTAKASKLNNTSSPAGERTPTLGATAEPQTGTTPFSERQNAGQIIEQLNGHIELPEAPDTVPSEPRVKLKANTELSKFAYKPMAMKLSEASEILDDRIDEFVTIVQEHHKFPDSAFGNPAAQSPAEIIAVGRIASDAPEGRLNAASMVLETSRRMGAGLRIPLRLESKSYDFFPGKIVALRGINPSGEFFSVSEVIPIPSLPLPATLPTDLDIHNERLESSDGSSTRPLNIILGSGPYTPETSLDYSSLHELCNQALTTKADVLILNGPFLDIEHPSLNTGDFELPPQAASSNPDTATLDTLFRHLISGPLTSLTQSHPSITIILIPSIRDAVNKHISWPQDRFPRAKLGLPKQATCVTNPITLSINDFVVGISSNDALWEMQRQRVVAGPVPDTLASLSENLLTQRHYFPVFPPLQRTENGLAVGASVDISYSKLGEMLRVSPDVLVTPSVLTPFVKVVQSVLVVNPGTASKKRAPGTFARLIVGARDVKEEEREAGEPIEHEVFRRARCDVVRI